MFQIISPIQLVLLIIGIHALFMCIDYISKYYELNNDCKLPNGYDINAKLKGLEVTQCLYLNSTSNKTCYTTMLKQKYNFSTCS